MPLESRNIALLIDSDNARPMAIKGILDTLASYGTIYIRRAYGNWKQGSGWEEKLHPYAILPIQQFPYTKGKNATDLAMAVDAMELLFVEKVDGFALVTSDCDFTPLAMKIRSKGRAVYGFGEEKTPEAFRNACSEFFLTETFVETHPEGIESKRPPRRAKNELRGDTKLMDALRSAIDGCAEEDGWAFLGRIGQHIRNQSSLSPSNYGYARWSDLLRATEFFEEEARNQQPWFRRKRGAPAAKEA
jgi:uncharacterized protein (TIGR00288 family)